MYILFVYGFAVSIIMAGTFVLARGAGQIIYSVPRFKHLMSSSSAAISAALCTPPLMISLQASLNGSPELAFSAIAGSTIFLLFPLYGLWLANGKRPVHWSLSAYAGVGICLLMGLARDGALSEMDGLILLGLCLVAALHARLFSTYSLEPFKQAAYMYFSGSGKPCIWCAIAYILTGFGMLITGADILVQAHLTIAHLLHWSEFITGLLPLGLSLLFPLFSLLLGLKKMEDAPNQMTFLSLYALYIGLIVPAVLSICNSSPISTTYRHSLLWQWPAMMLFFLLISFSKPAYLRISGALLIALYGGYVVYLALFHL